MKLYDFLYFTKMWWSLKYTLIYLYSIFFQDHCSYSVYFCSRHARGRHSYLPVDCYGCRWYKQAAVYFHISCHRLVYVSQIYNNTDIHDLWKYKWVIFYKVFIMLKLKSREKFHVIFSSNITLNLPIVPFSMHNRKERVLLKTKSYTYETNK